MATADRGAGRLGVVYPAAAMLWETDHHEKRRRRRSARVPWNVLVVALLTAAVFAAAVLAILDQFTP